MPPVSRRALASMALALSGGRLFRVTKRAEPATRLYIGNAARLTARIPTDWTVSTVTIGSSAAYDYAGPSGFVTCLPVAGGSLDEACASVAASLFFADHASTVTGTMWSDHPAGQVDGQIKNARASALVVPHPSPFDLYGERMSYAALIADPVHFNDISQTMSFSSDRVTPDAFITSVLELVEARAYWSSGVDWDAARSLAHLQVEGLTEVSLAQGALAAIVQHLAGVGDNHSRVRSPRQSADQGQVSGVGFLLGGHRVLAVFEGGPADQAGVRAGDLLESVEGRPFFPTVGVTEPSALLGLTSQLTLRRAGKPEPITATVRQGEYSQYVAPSGRRLEGGLGAIEIPQFMVPGREVDYVAAARSVTALVDQSPTSGWVIDLRLNFGGSYSPMIASVGPMLGDGTFLGWRWPDDRQTWVTYEAGQILDDGVNVIDDVDLAAYPPVARQRPNPPVAVLTSSLTGSSGEVATLAFVGRPKTRSFGETTGGYTTGNVGYPLFDGSTLVLAEVAMTDRSGTTHLEGVEPDEIIPSDWETYGTSDDPALQAAIDWLHGQAMTSDGTPTP